MSDEAVIAQKSPFPFEVVEGKTYYWCSCGRSRNQPLCDGSHQGTEFQPLAFTAEKTDQVSLCGCKHTLTPPYCDGAHQDVD